MNVLAEKVSNNVNFQLQQENKVLKQRIQSLLLETDEGLWHRKEDDIIDSIRISKVCVLEYLRYQEDDYNEMYVYVSGEYDSNQTTFESLSNNLKIGVLAKSDTVGYTLLLYLRSFIDEHDYPMRSVIEEHDYNVDGFLDLTGIINDWKKFETKYGEKFPYKVGVIERVLTRVYEDEDGKTQLGEKILEKQFKDMDLWDIDRIEKKLIELEGIEYFKN